MTQGAMQHSQKSYQELDPVGGYSTRPVVFVVLIGGILFSTVQTLIDWNAVAFPALALIALILMWGTAGLVTFWSNPMRAPFPRNAFAIVSTTAIGGMLLEFAASWPVRHEPLGEWGPIATGLIFAAVAPVVPARRIAISTFMASVIAGFVAVIHPSDYTTPMLVVIVEFVAPLAAAGFGGAAYAALLGRSTSRPQSRLGLAARSTHSDARNRSTSGVQRDRASILNRTVIPFFAEILERGDIESADRARSDEIARAIRSLMVADVDRSWLDAVVDQLALGRPDGELPGAEVIQDDERLATAMSAEQRVVIRALLVALFDQPGFDADGFGILISRDGASCVVSITAKLDRDESIPRSGLAPYFAVLRIAFANLALSFQPPNLTLRFSYEHK